MVEGFIVVNTFVGVFLLALGALRVGEVRE